MNPELKMWWDIEVRDRHGRTVYQAHEDAHSLLGNFVHILICAFYNTSGLTWPAGSSRGRNTANALVTLDTGTNIGQALGATSGQVDRSIVLGTNGGANTIDIPQLLALIAHGNAAGQLNYGASALSPPTAGTNPRVLTVSRTIGGNAISAVVVQELGFIENNPSGPFLIERSIVAPFNIPALGAATCAWTFSVTI